MTIEQAFAVAMSHHQSGRLTEAERLYRQILVVEPRHADALHLLGVTAQQSGRSDVAVEWIRQAIALRPDFPEAHYNLGIALREVGRLDEAIAACRQAIALRPNYAEAHSNLGTVLSDMGNFDEAIAAYREAIALQPNYPKAYYNLGAALKAKGRFAEANAAFRQAIAFQPSFLEAHRNLGDTLAKEGRLEEAIAAYHAALVLQPDHPQTLNNLSVALRDNGQWEAAAAACRQALDLKPDYPEAHTNYGAAQHDGGHLEAAIAAYRRAILLKPDFPIAHNNLGSVLKDTGQLDAALASYRQAIAFQPDFTGAHSNLLLTMNYHPGLEAREIAAEHQRWHQLHAESLGRGIPPHRNDRDPERRLRIGYVSADFREHAVAFFLEGLLAGHDPTQVEVYGYSGVARPDAVSARLQRSAACWQSIVGRSDGQVAELIGRDEIDILVDLAGHTASCRLLVFARRPAPVQVTWLGYPNTTGLSAMDYRLTDAFADPPGTSEDLHTEQLVRLPASFACFRPAADSPPVGPLPARARGQVTFGSFHILAKLNERLLGTWARILAEVPGSRLMIVAPGVDERSCQQPIAEIFEKNGIGMERITFKPGQTLPEYLALHHEVDVLLDSHPFSGHTVSCHALWMGVPVVTRAGAVHRSRMVSSVLANVGLSELVAQNEEEYVRLAVGLATDLPRLTHLRRTLRARMDDSPLLDAPRFARDLEAAYRTMWRKWAPHQPHPAFLANVENARKANSRKTMKSVLNVGGGSKAIPIPSYYQGWQQVLLDIDPNGDCDIALDARLLHTLAPATYDAVYCSHNLEHYHRHHGVEVLRGMHHVLKPDGFLEIRVPDVGEVMRLAVQNQIDLDDALYHAPAGPILLRDVLWGYHPQIEQSGRDYFAHKTGFTLKSLVNFVTPIGFPVHATRQEHLEIIAIFFKQHPGEEQQRLLNLKTPP